MNAYTFHINLYDLAFLGTVFIGLYSCLLLWFTKSINRAANRFLALALAVIVLWITRILGIDIGLSAYMPRWSWLPLQFSMALGPLIYFYVLKLTHPDYKFRLMDLLHFSPLLLELGAHVLAIWERSKTGMPTYNTLRFQQLNPVIQLLAFISVGSYLYLANNLIEQAYQRITFIRGDRYRYQWRWLRNLLIGLSLLWLLWVPYVAVEYFYYHHQPGLQAYYPIYLLVVVIFIRIATVAFLRPVTGMSARTPPISIPPLPAELKQKGVWLKQAMKTNRYYQDPELTLNVLAGKLGLNPHELSRTINTALKKSFNDFINEYRVVEAIQKMQEPAFDHITLLGIAFESGFNSQTTFSRIFKQMTGKSPLEYKNDLKKDCPSYNLGSHRQIVPVILNREATPQWSHEKLNRNIMFKNYFKTAWRTLWKQKAFSTINVLGLAIGISASLVIYLIVSYDLSFDKFEADHTRIYRVVSAYVFSGDKSFISAVPVPLEPAIKSEITGIDAITPFFTFNSTPKITIPGAKNTQPTVFQTQNGGFVYADQKYFEMVGYNWLAGSAKTSLQQPYQVVLNQSSAALYFPNLQPAQIIGKQFYMSDTVAVTVTGIVQDIKANTDFKFRVFVSKATLETVKFRPAYFTNWSSTNGAAQLYVKLNAGASPQKIQKEITALYFHHNPKKAGDNYELNFVLQPLNDIHFNASYPAYGVPQANSSVLLGLLAVASFLLLLGCINFINLTTAQSAQRAKEIGIRKTIGGSKKQLITQFLSESFLLTFTATVLSVCLTPVILKAFSGFVPDAVKFNILQQPGIILFLLILIIVVTLLSGFYPALVLSSYKPVAVLKNQISKTAGTRSGWLRITLTVSQFTIAQFFVMATLLVSKQVSYSLHKDMGFRKDAIVNFSLYNTDTVKGRREALLNRLRAIPGIAMISLSNNAPSTAYGDIEDFKYKDGKKEIETVAALRTADTNYIKLYGIKLLAGTNISSSNSTNGILINETFLRVLGLQRPLEAIGKNINWNGKAVAICGVVKDFNQKSLHDAIKPLVIAGNPGPDASVNLLLQPNTANGATWETALDKTKKAFKEIYPDNDFDYGFFDEYIAGYYQQEQNTSSLLNWATALSIFISCLGLLGLVIFTTTRRTKEIGVRKVLGATVVQIITLISKDFLRLVLIAFIIAVPLAWIGMHQWLQNFAYRTAVSWWIFAAAVLLMMTVAFITLSFQAIRAALANPVKSLRSE